MFINMKDNPNIKWLAIALIVSTIMFIIGTCIAIYFIFLYPINKGKTTALITDVTGSSTTVTYKVNGKVYKRSYSAYSSTYYVGKKISIYYNKVKPYQSSISSMRYLSLIGPGIGIIFLGISGIMSIVVYNKYYKV